MSFLRMNRVSTVCSYAGKVGQHQRMFHSAGVYRTVTKTMVSEGDNKTFPKRGDIVSVHYVGKFRSGQKFDSSYDRDDPLEFKVQAGMVIPGFDKAVMSMSLNEKAIVEITSDDAYGPRGAPPVIPGNTDLVFELELLNIH